MKLETFFEKFDLFADAPNAVAKMRELVLQLAVRGKLVEQRPEEGDGYSLLRHIQKKIPPSVMENDVEPVDAELSSFPSSWAASNLGSVAEIIRGVTFPGSAKLETCSEGYVACLRTASVQAEIDWDDLIYISPTHVSRDDQWVMPQDIMISMANSYALVGKVAIVREVLQKATFGAFLAAIRPVLIEPYFLLYVLRSPRMQAAFRASSSQTTNIANISLGRMRPLPVPLPPLAEQKRIVAKVDELMALCDRLEAQQQERETRHAALSRASLARFADAPTPANLNYLFHPSFNIHPSDLRKSILTLAVQGKLVPRIKADGLGADILKDAGLSEEALDELPELPIHWVWVHLGKITTRMDSGWSPACIPEPASKGEWGVLKTTAVQTLQYREEENKTLPQQLQPRPEHEVMDGDILFTRAGPMNRVGILCVARPTRKNLMISDKIIRFHLIAGIDADFAALSMNAGYSSSVVEGLKSGMAASQVNISQPKLRSVPIPLPPLAEQKRIVAKVDQLMALVEELETKLTTARKTAEALMEAAVAELTGGGNCKG